MLQAQDKLESPTQFAPKPVSSGNVQLVGDVLKRCERAISQEALELRRLIARPHFRALIETHDSVADFSEVKPVKTNGTTPSPTGNHVTQPRSSTPTTGEPPPDLVPPDDVMPADAIRMVGLRKSPNEPLVSTLPFRVLSAVSASCLSAARRLMVHQNLILMQLPLYF